MVPVMVPVVPVVDVDDVAFVPVVDIVSVGMDMVFEVSVMFGEPIADVSVCMDVTLVSLVE